MEQKLHVLPEWNSQAAGMHATHVQTYVTPRQLTEFQRHSKFHDEAQGMTTTSPRPQKDWQCLAPTSLALDGQLPQIEQTTESTKVKFGTPKVNEPWAAPQVIPFCGTWQAWSQWPLFECEIDLASQIEPIPECYQLESSGVQWLQLDSTTACQ